jgi:glucokinase-like ROK family protein
MFAENNLTKPNLQGTNINLVKAHNLRAVLLTLLHEPSLSRVQLAKQTNLSNTTITNLVAELIELGIVSEEGESPLAVGEIRPVGRPRTGIRLEPAARFVVGVHIGVGIFRVAIANLRDEILHKQSHEFDIRLPALEVLDQIALSIEETIASSQVERDRILGVGVGASGLVDYQSGTVVMAPNLNWRDIPLKDYLHKAVKLPVVVDNNVRAMAFGETHFGAGRDTNSLAFVYGRIGVGAGLTYKGQVYRGSAMGAGEIGHTIMLLYGGDPCRCGNSGCLETLVSEVAILRQAEDIAQLNPGGILAHTMQGRADLDPIERVFAAARQGDEIARRMLAERAHYLGVALVNLVNLYNPELILLGGIFAQGQDFFLEPALNTVRECSFGGMGQSVRVQATGFEWKAGVIGAAALALMSFFYHSES